MEWSRGVGYDDLIQEGWIKLIELAERYNPEREAKFSTFAYRRLHGHIKDVLDKELDSPKGVWWDLDETSKPSYNDPKDYWTVEEKTRHFEKETRLDFIISNLPDRQEKIARMRMEGYTQQEIADSEKIEVSRSRIAQILPKIKNEIRESFKMD